MNNPVSSVCIPEPAENQQPVVNLQVNPFDPARLRLSQDFVAAAGVKKILTTVPVRKPSKEWFVRTHPDPTYHINSCVIELKEDSEVYLVDRPLWDMLAAEATFGPRALITTINKQGVLFLWPIRLAQRPSVACRRELRPMRRCRNRLGPLRLAALPYAETATVGVG
jgi:hypothetical protein